jgi:hypothetical protein
MKQKTAIIIISTSLFAFAIVYGALYFSGAYDQIGDYDDCRYPSYSRYSHNSETSFCPQKY